MSTATLGAAALAGPAAIGNATGVDAMTEEDQGPHTTEFVEAVFDAFERHRLVSIGEVHGLQEHNDALVSLMTNRRFPEVVDDVVFEACNSLYQDVIDRFMSGVPVENADLRAISRNNTNSPLATGDEPGGENRFRVMRAVNWRRPATQRVRALLGDPPIDWPKITTPDQVNELRNQRDAFAASLVLREVLDRGRRALILYGSGHVMHHPASASQPPGQLGLVALIEQQTGQRVFSMATLVPLAGDPGGLATRLASYPRVVVIPTAGTWLGKVNAGDVFPAIAPGPSGPINPKCGVPLGSLLDAGLYLGQPGDLTMSRPNPAIYLDLGYWAELQRRNALQGGVVDLSKLRQEQSVRFTPESIPPPLVCK